MIKKFSKLYDKFSQSERFAAFLLFFLTVVSLLIANSSFASQYISVWHQKMGVALGSFRFELTLEHWINDGLMVLFFLLIGLEIERELYVGELKKFKNAILPICAAIGGMLLPAGIHLLLNYQTAAQAGVGIPIATDIAFSLAVLSLLGKKIPFSLKIFLTALAIIDDIGAVLLIAIFYSKGISLVYLGGALTVFALLLFFNYLKIRNLYAYMVAAIPMWYCMMQSGVHATTCGILLAFVIPFGDGSGNSPSERLQEWLHTPVAFIVLPLFALANTAIPLSGSLKELICDPNAIGIFLGLVIGKPMGILIACALAIKSQICSKPSDMTYRHIIGAGMLAGIGFTMSIFITLLAFDDMWMIHQSKIAVITASIVAAISGYLFLSKDRSVKQQ